MLDEHAFRSPPTECRGGPFWVWNDTMEETHLSEQVESMREAGWGSFFPHARFGLTFDCLSEEWFEKVAFSVEEGIDAGMRPWLYDEDHWPSGYAGGAIPDLGPEYRVKCLALKSELAPYDDPLDVVERDGDAYHVAVTTAPRDATTTAGGTPYVDLMNPDVVDEFVARTYDRYDDYVGDHFGDDVPGIFTDEPQLFVKPDVPDLHGFVPWTVGLPALFEREYGYDLLEHLPSLFFDADANGRSCEAVRYDFWRLVTERFVETFSERLGEWCRERDLALTGHYQHEHSIHEQIRTAGAVMPHYAHQGQPGIDHLGRNVVNRQNNPLKAKQCSSVARQFGRDALCEVYGCSGQQLTFEDRKWLGDWQLVHGVTFINHHLSLYSMRGERKRDYPPNIFYQQPWWEYNDRVADYLARTVYALRRGRAFADTLVLHPVQTGWISYSNFSETDLSAYTEHETMATEAAQRVNEKLDGLIETLLAGHVNFDFGDELILEDVGSVDDGAFVVGEAAYDTVVLPHCRTLQASTVDLLEAFADAGGTVLVVGEEPALIEGRPAEGRLDDLLDAAESTDADGVVERARRPVRLLDAEGREAAGDVAIHVRDVAGGLIAFLVNPDREESERFTLRFDRVGRVERWRAESGERDVATATARDGGTDVEVELPPTGSLLLSLDESGEPSSDGVSLRARSPSGAVRREEATGEKSTRVGSTDEESTGDGSAGDDAAGDGSPDGASTPGESTGDAVPIEGEWRVEREDPNQLVIDTCDLVLDGEELGRTNVAAHWQEKTELRDPDGHVPFEATYEFEVDEAVADGEFGLVVESADEQTVRVNGTDLDPTGDRWRDVHWHRFDVTDHVRAGTNAVTLTGRRSATVSVEPVYVLGGFAVESDTRRLIAEPATVDPADVTDQGYPFYAGELTLETTVTRDEPGEAALAFDRVNAVLAKVAANDGEERELYWRPWRAPVSLDAGENELSVTLVTSLRNLTGPLHTDEPAPTFVTPESFRPDEANAYLEKNEWVDEYVTVPVGVEGPRLRFD
jgi:hypothetical protein